MSVQKHRVSVTVEHSVALALLCSGHWSTAQIIFIWWEVSDSPWWFTRYIQAKKPFTPFHMNHCETVSPPFCACRIEFLQLSASFTLYWYVLSEKPVEYRKEGFLFGCQTDLCVNPSSSTTFKTLEKAFNLFDFQFPFL